MSQFLSRRINPAPVSAQLNLVELIDGYFTAYNSARLREACQLLSQSILQPSVTVGMSLAGAMTPAGFGTSIVAPLMRSGWIDWMVSTGANLYHDLHFGLGLDLYSSNPFVDDVKLRQEGRIRIYDIIFDYDVLLGTDAFIRQVIQAEPFQKRMGTAEFHYLLGKYVHEVEVQLGAPHASLLSTAYQCGVPIYTSSPGDSSIGMNIAAMALAGNRLRIDPMVDVNESAAIAYAARDSGFPEVEGKSAALIIGGGSPKNFLLQTQPHLHEVLGLAERGHDYFIQITDARPDTGGLSGATPSEAVSWGKVDPEELPSAIVCYTDSTIALPLITGYVMQSCPPRPLKRLYDRREAMMDQLKSAYQITRQADPNLDHELSPVNHELSPADRSPLKSPIGATYPCGTPRRQ